MSTEAQPSATAIERIELAMNDLRQGKMVVLVDDEDRENEGDLVMAADRCEPHHINFMAKHARGLICLTLTDDRVRELALPMMADNNQSPRSTAFTVSIEAREGVTTGISAADRAHTVRVAVHPDAKAEDIVSPGHVFPLKARAGGVLERTGHTEGSVDLARLAGCAPAGVICEIMNDDGTMARMEDLTAFAKTHELALVSIADLVQYRLRHERAIRKVMDGSVEAYGTRFKTVLFRTDIDDREYLALSLGDVSDGQPALVRMHRATTILDAAGIRDGDRGTFRDALKLIVEARRGVLVLIAGANRSGSIETEIAPLLGAQRATQRKAEQGLVFREYGLGAQVLRELGVTQIKLITNRSKRIAALDGYGLEVVDEVPF